MKSPLVVALLELAREVERLDAMNRWRGTYFDADGLMDPGTTLVEWQSGGTATGSSDVGAAVSRIVRERWSELVVEAIDRQAALVREKKQAVLDAGLLILADEKLDIIIHAVFDGHTDVIHSKLPDA